jgi:predicted Zn-dependent protease
VDRVITKTLGEVYLQQGHLQKAYEIFKVLSEKDPSDTEIQKRLKELREKLNLPPASIQEVPRSAEEKIRILKRWLANIQERKRG